MKILFVGVFLSFQLADGQYQQELCMFRGRKLPPADFNSESCGQCLIFIPPILLKGDNHSLEHLTKSRMLSDARNVLDLVNPTTNQRYSKQKEKTKRQEFLRSLRIFFKDPEDISLLTDCCLAAETCCEKIAQTSVESKTCTNESCQASCPPTWDGWQCWPDGGTAGETVEGECPLHMYFFTKGMAPGAGCQNKAKKKCESSGEWFQNLENLEWTDFDSCDKSGDLKKMEYLRISLYTVSALSLIPAIGIFLSYRSLQVSRISIHKNFFISLLLFTVTTLSFRAMVLMPFFHSSNNSIMKENGVGCRLLSSLVKYFRLTNFTWMWNEGYYLHHLLEQSFEDQDNLVVIYIVGWGVPIIPTLLYSIIRTLHKDENCWAASAEEWVEWITYLPGLLCLAGNIFFFLNIFRIFVTKLRSPHASEPDSYRKAVKGCSVLVPMFGLHWLLTLYRPRSGDCYFLAAYKYLDIILDTSQGLFVSITLCYRNSEIVELLRRSFDRLTSRVGASPKATGINRRNNRTIGITPEHSDIM